MGTCWYCYWGWAKPVADIYIEARKRLDGDESPLEYGPAHIVWADENWDSAEWCLEHFDEYRGDHSDADLAVVRWSLEELAKIPLADRDVCPAKYDDENPANYPPTCEMVRIGEYEE